jgi:TonB-linked SusC/RagA family outer membrane protein
MRERSRAMMWIPWLLSAAAASTPTLAIAQQAPTGSITGRVVDQTTKAPIAEARIRIVGTTVEGVTNATGEYRLNGVRVGPTQLGVIRIGYKASSDTVRVAAGVTSTVNFSLVASVAQLDQVVVTGTAGNQERRAQAAQVASISASDIKQDAAINSVSDMLQSRVPGVSVGSNSGSAGTGSAIRIRGASSLSLSNQPLVFVDGVRMVDGAPNIGVLGQTADRMNDLNPDDIESIEVVKGPAAATLYGADASTGVIQIITKRGKAGSNTFQQAIRAELGTRQGDYTPPSNFARCTTASVATTSINPLCRGQAVGTLVSDNPLARTGAFRDGSDVLLGWTGRGGGQNYGYYVSLGNDRNLGTLPTNEFSRQSFRTNFNFVPSSKITVDVGLQATRSYTRLTDNDNSIYGFLGGALLGSPLTRRDDGLPGQDGWYGFNRQVEAISSINTNLETQRSLLTATGTYLPVTWFKNRFTVGGDVLSDNGTRFFPKNSVGWYDGTLNTGSNLQSRVGTRRYTADYLGDFEKIMKGGELKANVSIGAQVIATKVDSVGTTGLGFATNSSNVISSAATTSGGQSILETRQLGYLAQGQLGWLDRRYLTIGARLDKFSAFGSNTPAIFLPKIGASWVVSDEDFFQPASKLFSSLRLRAAYGTTGRSPNAGASLQTLTPQPSAIVQGAGTVTVPGATLRNPGNPDLKPEKGTEIELGADATLFDDRVSLEVTYFNKTSKDVLLQRPIAPSSGFSENPFVNIGEINNKGFEVGVSGKVLDTRNFSWDSRFSFNTLDNKLVSLGGLSPFSVQLNRFTQGVQAGTWGVKRIKNINEQTGVVTVTDTIEAFGNVLPTFEGSWSNTFTVLKNFRVATLMDTKRNYLIRNLTEFYRETQLVNSDNRLNVDKLSPVERLRRYGNQTAGQPAFVQENGKPTTNNEAQEGFLQKGDFIRLREVSVTYSLPTGVTSRLGPISGGSIGLAFQNVKLWTDYKGSDPEVNFNANATGTAQFGRQDFFTVPPGQRTLLRMNFNF